MLPVVSARKKMSGLGGIGDVSTDFAWTFDCPGSSVAVTVAGVTPGTANAAPETTVATSPASAAVIPATRPRRRRVSAVCIDALPLTIGDIEAMTGPGFRTDGDDLLSMW
jgi:hypothetical protein